MIEWAIFFIYTETTIHVCRQDTVSLALLARYLVKCSVGTILEVKKPRKFKNQLIVDRLS